MISRGYSSWSAQTGDSWLSSITFQNLTLSHILTLFITRDSLTIATADRVVAIISRPAVKSASETGHNIFVLSGHEESY